MWYLFDGVRSFFFPEKKKVRLLTVDQLKQIMPRLPPARADELFPHLSASLAEFEISTPKRAAAYLAQLAHESNELRWLEEIATGEAYEGRKDLGNVQPGDGRRYKGRGPIQLTGRGNYRTAGQALSVDLEGDPGLAATPAVGFRVAGWYWKGRGLNELADAGDFVKITRKINGGLNGLPQRERYWARAKQVLGVV